MKTKFENIVTRCQLRFNHGNPGTWKHSDFEELSRQIFRETKVSISTNTLKRIFGKIRVDEYYIPQQATIQALEKYGQDLSAPLVTEVKAQYPAVAELPEPVNYRLNRLLVPAAIIVILLLAISYFRTATPPVYQIRFVSMEGLLPATAFFEYEVPESKDSVFLDFGDKTELVYVQPGKVHLSHPYLFPGVFPVTLRTRKEKLQSVNVYVRSDNWIGLGYRQGGELPKNYYEFVATKTGKDSLFHISNAQLSAKGIDTSGLVYTRLCNFTPIAYQTENFVFEATFKNKIDEKEIYCKSTQFQVSGMKNRIRFRLATPGCSNRISNLISEQSYLGTRVNLSRFTLDLSKWTTVKMINHHHKISLFVNNKLLYSGSYREPIGAIKGVFLEFEGTAFVKSCQLRTEDGKILYSF
jgi:hypothetical protein